MTWATRITVVRLLLIPFFIGALLYYHRSLSQGHPIEEYRIAAIVIFLVAAISDGIDGYLARHFNQKSSLGTLLDPIADKLLMLAALIMLSQITGPGIQELPLWFVVLVIGRDVLLLLGTIVLNHLNGQVNIHPHWTGKLSTCLVFTAISAALLKLPWTIGICYAGGLFTLICTALYIREGLRQLHTSGSTTSSK